MNPLANPARLPLSIACISLLANASTLAARQGAGQAEVCSAATAEIGGGLRTHRAEFAHGGAEHLACIALQADQRGSVRHAQRVPGRGGASQVAVHFAPEGFRQIV